MTAPKRELLANNVLTTTLDGGIDGSQTSIDVTDGSVFPTTGNFRIRIGNELLLVTARSSDTLTVVRGIESSTATSHGNGDEVAAVLTAGGLTRWAWDKEPLWGYSSAPPVGKIVGTDGKTLLTSSDFTWINQGGTSVTDENGTILMRTPGASGENVRLLKRSNPGTPYTVTIAYEIFAPASGSGVPNLGLACRQSSSGKLYTVAINTDEGSFPWTFAAYTFNSPTSFNATEASRSNGMTFPAGKYFWLKIEDDGTDLKAYVGYDGFNWFLIDTHDRDSFMTSGGPDEIGWYANNHAASGGFDILHRLVHWSTG